MLAGLAEAGADLTDADVVIGTSAGSIVGAQLTSRPHPLDELYARQLAAPAGRPTGARIGPAVLARFAAAALRSGTRRRSARGWAGSRWRRAPHRKPNTGRPSPGPWSWTPGPHGTSWSPRWTRRPGTARPSTAPAASRPRRGERQLRGAGRLPARHRRREAVSGRRSALQRQRGPGRGVRPVVVIAPITTGGGPIVAPRTQAARLAGKGARVYVITPDRAARSAFGRNILDPAKRADAARAGRRQSATHAAQVRALWTD
ncbi:patatin-like phospholipase family protein [Streptomyces albulus]|nr:patatin-like phospholipase family protein [Streptomyces noursei]